MLKDEIEVDFEARKRPGKLLKKAVKTMRKLPCFGMVREPVFEWPTAAVLLAMPPDKPIKVDSFEYRFCKGYGLHSVSVKLTNNS